MGVLRRVDGVLGELVLRADGEDREVILNGSFLMDSRSGDSERALAREARARSPRPPLAVSIGGLGVGTTLREVLTWPEPVLVTVVEIEPALVAWHREGLFGEPVRRALADPRVEVVESDLAGYLRSCRSEIDVLLVDTDNGPDWLVHGANASLWQHEGLAAMAVACPGVIAFWSAAPSDLFEARLRSVFDRVDRVDVPVRGRGEPDVIYIAG